MVEDFWLIPLPERRFNREHAQMKARKEREEHHLFVTEKVITDETFSHYQGSDLAVFDRSDSKLPMSRVFKQEPPAGLRSPQDVRLNVISDDRNTQRHSSPTLTIAELAHLDHHGRVLSWATSSSYVSQDSEPEIERRVNEMDTVGSPAFPIFHD